MTTRVIAAPAYEPITLAQAKLHARVDSSDEDSLFSILITSAREYAETLTHRAFVQRTMELTLPAFQFCICLPYPPLVSVSYVQYIDLDGTTQTVDAADYQVDTYAEPGKIKPEWGESWPVVVRPDFNAVRIRYIAGYAIGSPVDQASATENIPASLKQWMLIRVATLYDQVKSGIRVGNIVTAFPRDHVDGLLDSLLVDIF